MLSRFHLYRNVTDRQTDRFAISISRVSMLMRDKNWQVIVKPSTMGCVTVFDYF